MAANADDVSDAPHVFCELCQKVVRLYEQVSARMSKYRAKGSMKEIWMNHHSSAAQLEASSKSCIFCKHLAEIITRQQAWESEWNKSPDSHRPYLNVSLWAHPWATEDLVKIRLSVYGFDGDHTPWVQLHRLVIREGFNKASKTSRRQSSDHLLEQKTAQIRTWLEKCCSDQSHTTCSPASVLPDATYPGRLLDVGTGAAPVSPRVVITRELPKTAVTYLTLSHCWGTEPGLVSRLTTATQVRFKKGISLGALPRTFRDAIAITRTLGVRYIWIDSLCIIQDSREDWEIESAKMASIYACGQLCIAATSAADSNGGCIFNFNPDRTVDFHGKVSLPDNSEGKQVWITIDEEGDDEHVRQTRLERELRAAPLNSRGWALQESLLAPRTVSFTHRQMYWECRSRFCTEDGRHDSEPVTPFKNQKALPWGQDPWWHIIQEFCRRSLTKPRDRPAAIAGITEAYQHLMKMRPLLGLWHQSIDADLAWFNPYREEVVRITDLSWIPSWSWLSVGSHFQTPGIEGRASTKLRVEEWNVKWKGPAFTSELLQAELVVSSLVGSLPLTYYDTLPITPGMTKISRKENRDDWGNIIDESVFDFDILLFQADMSLAADELEQMVLLHLRDKPNDGSSVGSDYLALMPTKHGQKTAYRRVGRFQAGWGPRNNWTHFNGKQRSISLI